MRVQLKGINRISKKLADGSRVTYFYAWKGGPRLPGKPGSTEFVDAYNAAIAEKVRQPAGTIQAVLNAYQDSPKYLDLADRTRKDYVRQIRQIEAEFADFPLAALADRRTRGEFLAWRDKLAIKSRRQADRQTTRFPRSPRLWHGPLTGDSFPRTPAQGRANYIVQSGRNRSGPPMMKPRCKRLHRPAFGWHICWRSGQDNGKATCCD